MQRRIVEIKIPGVGEPQQTVVDYQGPITDILDFVSLAFAPIEGESSYRGWHRCTINVSGPCCTAGEPYTGCTNELGPEEMETQICWECAEQAQGEEPECDQCGVQVSADKLVEIKDAEGVPVMTFCADCAEQAQGEE
jgi:hypothetical protein